MARGGGTLGDMDMADELMGATALAGIESGPNLSSKTPAEIDTLWADELMPIYAALGQVHQMRDKASRAQEALDNGYPRRHGMDQDQINNLRTQADQLQMDANAELERVEAPFNAEFDARGGWPRAYKVVSSDGHIHSSTRCSTCFATTQFAWITGLSGHDESEIAELAGERACTVCYPEAPVDRPCQIFTPEEKDAAEQKALKAEKLAAKKADAQTKAILDVDGGPLRSDAGTGYIVNTERTARIGLVDSLHSQMSLDDSDWHQQLKAKYQANAEHMARAIAHKTGEDYDALIAEAQDKADKKYAKDLRAWAKDPRNPDNYKD